MSSRPFVLIVAVAVLLAAATTAEAGRHGGRGCATCAPATCAPACQPCVTYQQVERTVLVPTLVTEMRTISVTKCRPEVRQHTYTVMRQVPETKQVSYEYTVLVPENRVRTEQFTVCVPVQRIVERPYTVNVPYTETRTATRTVCKMVPETVMQTVYECSGHWEERCVNAPAPCAPATCAPATCCPQTCCAPITCRVWVPETIAKQVPVTCMKPVSVQEQFNYNVTLCRAEQRVEQVTVCEYKQEIRTREVPYTVCVPQKRVATQNVTTMRCVPEQRTSEYTVMVPYQEEQQIPVQVCKYVPQTITECVAVPQTCAYGAAYWGCGSFSNGGCATGCANGGCATGCAGGACGF